MQIDDQTMFAEGFEEAFLGLGTQAGKQVAVYNKQKIFEILQKEMSSEEAVEYYQFNMECAFVGERRSAKEGPPPKFRSTVYPTKPTKVLKKQNTAKVSLICPMG